MAFEVACFCIWDGIGIDFIFRFWLQYAKEARQVYGLILNRL